MNNTNNTTDLTEEERKACIAYSEYTEGFNCATREIDDTGMTREAAARYLELTGAVTDDFSAGFDARMTAYAKGE